MKKIYFIVILAFGLVASTNAQVDFDFDSFSVGDVVGQAPEIVLWPAAGVTSSQVTTAQAFSGSNSVVTRPQSGGNVDDILINLGNKSSGVWSVQFMMYVPTGATGFWNIQNDENFTSTAEAQWNGQFFVGETTNGGNPGVITWDQDNQAVPYLENTWFQVSHILDFDNGTHTVDIDGSILLDAVPYNDTDGNPAGFLGAINYFAIDANNEYYIDDFRLTSGNVLSIEDEFDSNNFSVYPNPVQDVLNIKSAAVVNEVVVYDILGKVVLQSRPDAISPSINMSGLNAGAYMVKVTIDGVSKTTKVIK